LINFDKTILPYRGSGSVTLFSARRLLDMISSKMSN
jgi:hypothetical protein